MLLRLMHLVRRFLSRVGHLLRLRHDTTRAGLATNGHRGAPPHWLAVRDAVPPADWLARVGATALQRHDGHQVDAAHAVVQRVPANPHSAGVRAPERDAHALLPWAARVLAANRTPRTTASIAADSSARAGTAVEFDPTSRGSQSSPGMRLARLATAIRTAAPAFGRRWRTARLTRHASAPGGTADRQAAAPHGSAPREHASSTPHRVAQPRVTQDVQQHPLLAIETGIPHPTHEGGQGSTVAHDDPDRGERLQPPAREDQRIPSLPGRQAPATSTTLRYAPSPAASAGVPVDMPPVRWPSLPTDPPRAPRLDVDASHREFERMRRLDREQRGVPWNESRF